MNSFSPIKKPFEVSVLIVDDEACSRNTNKLMCARLFSAYGEELSIKDTSDVKGALALLSEQTFQVVLLDRDLGKDEVTGEQIDGLDYIKEILAIQPLTQILVLTGSKDDIAAHTARDLGAYAYLLKAGGDELDAFRDTQIKMALGRAHNLVTRERMERQHRSETTEWVCVSPSMKRLQYQLEGLAIVSRPILLLGESGLGKTATAKKLNQFRAEYLKQKDRPFFNINIAAIGSGTAISELFGHEAGSFTSSGSRPKIGFFELAKGGDIFLDEIGDASEKLQKILLKVIEEREFFRMGGTTPIKTDAQVILATNKDLKKMVGDGIFREDLYNRISTFVIEMPTLAERKEDRPELVRILLAKACAEIKRRKAVVSEFPLELMDYLSRDDVPGNIRGIENDIFRILVGCINRQSNDFDFSKWREALQLRKTYKPLPRPVLESISYEQFLNLPTDILGTQSPGLSSLKKLFVEKILKEAEKKYPSVKERAEVLKMPVSNVYRLYSLSNSTGQSDKKERSEVNV